MMLVVQVYSRPGCHLCERMVEELMPLLRGRARVEVLNVDTCVAWQREFGTRVPVLEIGGRVVCEFKLDVQAVRNALSPGQPATGRLSAP